MRVKKNAKDANSMNAEYGHSITSQTIITQSDLTTLTVIAPKNKTDALSLNIVKERDADDLYLRF